VTSSITVSVPRPPLAKTGRAVAYDPAMEVESLVERVTGSGRMPLHVITACDSDHRDGCLVGFATQASISPARLLVCLSVVNLTYRIAVSSPALAVHLVPHDRHDIAELFGGETGDDTDKLARVAWTAGPGGLPLLDDCPVRLVGRVVSRHPFGDHEGFLLEPLGKENVPRQEPLIAREALDIQPGHPA
jgi:flavin reductase (DIM6/NTAB) family NADH-FMN oxidoreductase RutF